MCADEGFCIEQVRKMSHNIGRALNGATEFVAHNENKQSTRPQQPQEAFSNRRPCSPASPPQEPRRRHWYKRRTEAQTKVCKSDEGQGASPPCIGGSAPSVKRPWLYNDLPIVSTAVCTPPYIRLRRTPHLASNSEGTSGSRGSQKH